MKKFAKIIAGLLAFLFLIAGTSQAYAQPIPISGCTIITQPGSYIVTNNIAASPFNVQNLPGGGVTCIGIAADFVTLDLGGFTITAFNLPATPFEQAIRTDFVDRKGINVHSGTVANFSGAAVFLIGLGHTVEHIRAVNNHGGIVVTSLGGPGTNGHRIIGNTVLSNTMGGIEVGCPALVVGNVAAGNGNGTPGEQIFEVPPAASASPCTNAENVPNLP